jgi:hypothetical protein
VLAGNARTLASDNRARGAQQGCADVRPLYAAASTARSDGGTRPGWLCRCIEEYLEEYYAFLGATLTGVVA